MLIRGVPDTSELDHTGETGSISGASEPAAEDDRCFWSFCSVEGSGEEEMLNLSEGALFLEKVNLPKIIGSKIIFLSLKCLVNKVPKRLYFFE